MNLPAYKIVVFVFVAAFILVWTSRVEVLSSSAQDRGTGVQLTLLPDYQNMTVRFVGTTPIRPSGGGLDLSGLPLQPPLGKHRNTHHGYWDFWGSLEYGSLTYHLADHKYHYTLGPVVLHPNHQLTLTFPFISIDPSEIQLQADPTADGQSQIRASSLSLSAGAKQWTITFIDIPFQPIQTSMDLTLIPLIGEALAGHSDGLRMSGKVQLSSLTDYEQFRQYCTASTDTLQEDDSLKALLLNILDYPHYSAISEVFSGYEYQPTELDLRTEMIKCEYDSSKKLGTVEAMFSGKLFAHGTSCKHFPTDLRGFVHCRGNNSPTEDSAGPNPESLHINLGQIRIAPGDTLTITVPHTDVLVNRISPNPHDLLFLAVGRTQYPVSVVYHGPVSFDLTLPYITKTELYLSQFPAIIRPGLLWIEQQFGNFASFPSSALTCIMFCVGLLFVLASRWDLNLRWLVAIGWLLLIISFYYGIRGSFGLLCIALLIFLSRVKFTGQDSMNKWEMMEKIDMGLVCFVVVGASVYLDSVGTRPFDVLSQTELSPLTPFILLLAVWTLISLVYSDQKKIGSFTTDDLPILGLFFGVLVLFDAFDKSPLALFIWLGVGIYVMSRAAQDRAQPNDNPFGDTLQKNWDHVFGNKIVLFALLVFMIFAIANDLSSIFSNKADISLPPLIAPLVMFFLVVVSVFLTLSSIAFLFILVYPYLPFTRGYWKATIFSLILFLVFLFGVGTDDRLIEFMPNLLVGRLIYYLSVPMLIGVTLDVYDSMERENNQPAAKGGKRLGLTFPVALRSYLKNFSGQVGTLIGIVSVVMPTVYSFVASQPILIPYFSLLEKLARLAS
jgi:hypothetical protein